MENNTPDLKENILIKISACVLPLIGVGILTLIGWNDHKGEGIFYLVSLLWMLGAFLWIPGLWWTHSGDEIKIKNGQNLLNITFALWIIGFIVAALFLVPYGG